MIVSTALNPGNILATKVSNVAPDVSEPLALTNLSERLVIAEPEIDTLLGVLPLSSDVFKSSASTVANLALAIRLHNFSPSKSCSSAITAQYGCVTVE